MHRGPEGTNWRNFICRSSHPFAAFFHLAFKMSALVLYLFGTLLFGMDYVTLFVMSVLLLAFDFWTVKNVSGRLLVGLRWWVSILPNGTNEWQFESAPNNQVPALDYRIFWWALYLAPLVWGLLGLLAFISLKLDWLLITLVGAGLTGAALCLRVGVQVDGVAMLWCEFWKSQRTVCVFDTCCVCS